ncbi:MAG: PEP-CTERM sorting domain-containing protein [Marinobacter sp.]|nr:PEP-CTERM sorting domain-containing protein [Marinobacter sp.]
MKMVPRIMAGLLLCCSLVSLPATASTILGTVDLTYKGYNSGGFPAGYRNGTITDHGTSEGASAGLFGFDVSNASSGSPIVWDDTLQAFCVQTNALLDTSNTRTYSLVSALDHFGNASLVDQIGRLYTGYHNDVTSADTSAAFQLALWELVDEDQQTNGLDLTGGQFTATSFNTARATANGWLSSLSSITNGFNLFVLENDGSQDLLVFKPAPTVRVPEPGTLALMCLGLLVLGLRMRKRH